MTKSDISQGLLNFWHIIPDLTHGILYWQLKGKAAEVFWLRIYAKNIYQLCQIHELTMNVDAKY